MALGGKLITVKDAAAILGLPESTVYNRKGGTHTLTRVKLGRAVRLVSREVEALKDKVIAAGKKEIGSV
jgi:predicted DNA-binding transcriptional regulator AlpA